MREKGMGICCLQISFPVPDALTPTRKEVKYVACIKASTKIAIL